MARVPERTRRLVLERDGHKCVRCGQHVAVAHLQHRCARGMGGSKSAWHNSPANLLTLCHRCHLYHVERRRLDAQLHGWAIRHGILDPSEVPVFWHGRWVLLDHDGGWVLEHETGPPPSESDGPVVGRSE